MESHQRRGINSHQRRDEKSHEQGGMANYSHGSVNALKLVVTLAVLIAASCFAYASLVSSACVDEENQCMDAERDFLSKLYYSESSGQYAKLKREFASESKSFEFMVWDRERTSLSKALLSLQHQRINLQPLDDELWLELNYLNQNALVTHSERSWALNRSEEVVGWNHEQSAQLVHHCVNEYEFYGQVITSSCVKNLVHLPADWSLGRIANKARLRAERIERARSEALKSQIIEAP